MIVTIRRLLAAVADAGHTTLIIDEMAVHVTMEEMGFSQGINTVIVEKEEYLGEVKND